MFWAGKLNSGTYWFSSLWSPNQQFRQSRPMSSEIDGCQDLIMIMVTIMILILSSMTSLASALHLVCKCVPHKHIREGYNIMTTKCKLFSCDNLDIDIMTLLLFCEDNDSLQQKKTVSVVDSIVTFFFIKIILTVCQKKLELVITL
jgi:hypothetical protein